MSSARLGIGCVGSGFITRFHIQSLVGVRDAAVRGVWSPNREHAEEAASLARSLGVGDAKAHTSIA
ncbi:MAG: gfo/Idh/MocA family oxidoreductase, partial [Gemmatimonadetes bacterium]|nr:gfo/Idh/MocA family oxidoreductase [Gemmatimonadota bacterium]